MKLSQLQQRMKQDGITTVVLLNLGEEPSPNFYYFCHYAGFGAFVIRQSGRPILIVPAMEEGRALAASSFPTKCSVVVYKKSLSEEITENLEGHVLGLDYSALTLRDHASLEKKLLAGKKHQKNSSQQGSSKKSDLNIIDISSLCEQLRMVKTDQELDIMRKAFTIADGIVEECLAEFTSFKTEQEVALFLEKRTLDAGCRLSFPVIVGSGKASAIPHYEPRPVQISRGFCVIDFGIKHQGYCTDMTRTVYVGSPSRTEAGWYSLLQEAQEKAIAMLQETTSCADLHTSCAKLLGKHQDRFIHSLGHGVGVEVHEAPSLSPRTTEQLEPGMVFTIEPGLYFPGKGGMRIEDTLIFGKNKAELLTKLPKGLILFPNKY